MLKVHMLPAGHGDCIQIEYGSDTRPSRMLIDGGVKETYTRYLKPRLDPHAPTHFELLVLTHIDEDHIDGLIELIGDRNAPATFGDIWFNGWHQLPEDFLSPADGIDFTGLIRERDLPWNKKFDGKAIVVYPCAPLPSREFADGLRLTVVSPTTDELVTLKRVWDIELSRSGLLEQWKREFLSRDEEGDPSSSMNIEDLAASRFKKDRSKPNGSSIALLAERDGKRVLLAGDAHAPVLVDSLRQLARERGEERLRLDAFKLPHHGSAKNLSNELLDVIDCRVFLFSTNGARHHHPDHKTVARILMHNRSGNGEKVRLLFNYRSCDNKVWDDQSLKDCYGYETCYPSNNNEGLEIDIR